MSLVLPRSNPKQTLCLHSANQRRNYVEAADPPCAHPRRTLPAMWSRSHDSAAATSALVEHMHCRTVDAGGRYCRDFETLLIAVACGTPPGSCRCVAIICGAFSRLPATATDQPVQYQMRPL
jgi:hypothetical protein